MHVQDYSVGWICPIQTEFVAARACLDERHEPGPRVPDDDENAYAFGRIAGHNIVIASLPKGRYGEVNAASVAKDMQRTFRRLRFSLLVGIGGGAPTEKHDIRLGDIVVSSPNASRRSGGVVHYLYGKQLQGKAFFRTGSLSPPPPMLLNALTRISAMHEEQGHLIAPFVTNVVKKNPRLKKKYGRPAPARDRLYVAHYEHQVEDSECQDVCQDAVPPLVGRPARTAEQDDPMIHYGLIATADVLMKDAHLRDQIAADEDILCFEMEAAGLMDFRCLVIRGICDYADTHKNDIWQGYAALVAAAFARELLTTITSNWNPEQDDTQHLTSAKEAVTNLATAFDREPHDDQSARKFAEASKVADARERPSGHGSSSPLAPDYPQTTKNRISSNFRTNWQNRRYLSKQDLNEILSEDSVYQLITTDRSLTHLPLTERLLIATRVYRTAPRLLAFCVFCEIPLVFLSTLLDSERDDSSLPLSRFSGPNSLSFLDWQAAFNVHVFVDREVPQHYNLPKEVVVPIRFDEGLDCIGRGAFASVYKVQIDEAHHSFPTDKGDIFALKKFHHRNERVDQIFETELKALQAASKSQHPYLISHLTSWTQDSNFYVLFPRADSNLRVFLRNQPQPTLDATFMRWLFAQLTGLASALSTLHRHGVHTEDGAFEELSHQDIKPSNILVFTDRTGPNLNTSVTDYSMRISDFGSAQIGQSLFRTKDESHSHLQASELEDFGYKSPDFLTSGRVSQLSDVWSLGCVFLEILLWALAQHSDSLLDDFAAKRLGASDNKSNQDDAFWQASSRSMPQGTIVLKAVAESKLQGLREVSRRYPALTRVVRNLEDMLRIETRRRSSAPDLASELRLSSTTLESELKSDPDMYLRLDRNADVSHLVPQDLRARPKQLQDPPSRRQVFDSVTWPTAVQELSWPTNGVTFSLENRYLVRGKLRLWLRKAFGEENAKFVAFNDVYYVVAPREPTQGEIRWMLNPDKDAFVYVEECGYLRG